MNPLAYAALAGQCGGHMHTGVPARIIELPHVSNTNNDYSVYQVGKRSAILEAGSKTESL